MSDFERQHPIAAVTKLTTAIRQNIIPIVLILVFGFGSSGDEYNLIAFGAVIIFALIYGVLSWWQYKFRIENGELHIKYGVFVKKNLYLSKQRIQVIDITEGIIQRAFGLVKMEIKTAGSGTERASISAISRERALELKALLGRKDVDQKVESDEDDWKVIEYKLPTRELMIAAFTSGSFGIIASIVGGTFSQVTQFVDEEESINYISKNLPVLTDVAIIAVVVILLILISWVISFIGVIVQYMDFKVQKTDKELIITRGLFERKQITVPFNRIQAIKIVEGFLRLPLNRAMIYIESAGFQNEKSKSVIAMPIIHKDKLQDFLNAFLDEYRMEPVTYKPPKRALLKYLRRPNYLLVIVATALLFTISMKFSWLFLLVIPFSYLGWLSYKESGAYTGKQLMVVITRFFNRKTILIKKPRVQSSEISRNPFQIRKDLSTFNVTVASGSHGVTFHVTDLDKDDAEHLLDWTAPVRILT